MAELVYDLALKALYPLFFPFLSTERIFWLYLTSALTLAYVAHRLGGACGKGPMAFLRYCFPRSVYAHLSARADYRYFFVNRVLFAILFAPFLVAAPAVAGWTADALAGAVEPTSGGPAAAALFTLVSLLAMDVGIFLAHYALHKVPVLWEFHKIHHSAEVLTPFTVYRMHPVDDLLTITVSSTLTGFVQGVFACFYADGVFPIQVYAVNAGLFVFYVAGVNLRHSHIWLSFPPALSRIFISPAQHQIHHSADARHFDRNMGFIFAFWDRIAGTLYVPEGREELEFGLAGDEHREYSGVLRFYFLPFAKLARRFRSAARLPAGK